MKSIATKIILTGGFCLLLTISFSQPAFDAYHTESLEMKIGPFEGAEASRANTVIAADEAYVPVPSGYQTFTYQVGSEGAAWLQLLFTDVNLGTYSYITITSDKDGGKQKLNAKSMKEWNNVSAMFNGGSVTLSVIVASTDPNIGFNVSRIVAGEFESGDTGEQPESVCGATDNRTASATGPIGRLAPTRCTGWLIANGAFLTAGHCPGDGTINSIHFNVPASNADGSVNISDPDDQYPIVTGSITFQNADANDDGGNDWTIFRVGANSNTDLTPNEAQGVFNSFDQTFFRVTTDRLPGTTGNTTTITGYGTDNIPVGSTGENNATSQTQQTHSGPFVSETVVSANDVSLRYTVDTEGGNSGSPIIMAGTINTVGIHTNAGCSPSTPIGSNEGTGFEEDDLATAIENFNGTTDTHVDNGHPATTTPGTVFAQNGSVFRPYRTINGAITAATAGNTLFIAEGGYAETVITSKNLIFTAPVGLVVIGPDAPATPASKAEELPVIAMEKPATAWEVYPNPFISKIHVKNNDFKDGDVRISLHNMLGQTVQTLSDHHNLEGDTYYENFNLSSLHNGIYLLSIETNGERNVTRMIKTE